MASKKEVWVATDGKQFELKSEAELYELKDALGCFFYTQEDAALWGEYHKIPGGDIVDFLVTHQDCILEFYKKLKDLQK
jgi:hypothetical protein